MNAQFHLAGDLDVAVMNFPSGDIVIETKHGVCHEVHDTPACAHIKSDVLSLTKGQARAIASAIMGCAAEA